MKKILVILVCIAALISFVSCSDVSVKDDGKTDVVCTSFAQYDWAWNIVKNSENVNLVLLNTKGTDMHSFEPSADDIIKVAESDILILVGGEGDKWAMDAVANNKKTTVISLLDLPQTDGNHGELLSHDHSEECEHSHASSDQAPDEHIWMSLKNAEFFVGEISEAICEKDSANADLYKENTDNYVNLLKQLDSDFSKTVSSAEHPVMVVADRFPFGYLAKDYGIECFAAFPGCSADTDASPDVIIRLSKALDEYDLSYVAVTESTTGKTAKAVIDNTTEKNQKTVVIDSMQSVSQKDIENGATYIGIMEQNLEAIKTLLEIK